ncbi:DUF4350 domain-containing protein [Streptomyces sp. NBC_00247]|uniref:DUF4350 domain-containing protein n=1 Tax=Streptomyces sp. NBC_00247 TaxID=2975689 RepID=UPI002E2C49B1|nr:DUF4350 domain-containing protein [Streptomyces sp. NBC_00247]
MTGPTKAASPAAGGETVSASQDTRAASGSAGTDGASAPTSLAATPAQLWKRARGFLVVLLVLIVGGITIAALRSGSHHGMLDPRSADPEGSRAVAELLRQRGVSVDVVTTLDDAVSAAGPDSTLLVAGPDLLTEFQQERLWEATSGSGGRTVLIAPGSPSVPALAPGVRVGTAVEVAARTPACPLPAARRAGTADLGGATYEAEGPGATGCYPAHGLTPLLVVPRHDGETVLLGSPDILFNRRLAHEGNASLALQLLGSRTHLVWYLPSLADPSASENGRDTDDGGDTGQDRPTDDEGEGHRTAGDPGQNQRTDGGSHRDHETGGDSGGEDQDGFFGLVPPGWLWGTLQLAVAALLAAAWRGRRFGPLVTEKLPVAVHASEATEGHARLYRRAGARDRAAALLRESARTRLAPLVGISPRDAHSPDVLVPALSARLPAGGALDALLFGPTPDDDTALVRLADQLDALEREVRTS